MFEKLLGKWRKKEELSSVQTPTPPEEKPVAAVAVMEVPAEEAIKPVEAEEVFQLSDISVEEIGELTDAESIIQSEYFDLARKAGFAPPPVLERMIKAFLKRENLNIYKFEDVNKFLDQMYGKFTDHRGTEEKPGWVWRPLTDQDRKANLCFTDLSNGRSGQIDNDRPYDYEIPLYILRLVAKIREEIPQAVLYVTDANVPAPDPFIAITGNDAEDFVFGHWNEPTFGV